MVVEEGGNDVVCVRKRFRMVRRSSARPVEGGRGSRRWWGAEEEVEEEEVERRRERQRRAGKSFGAPCRSSTLILNGLS